MSDVAVLACQGMGKRFTSGPSEVQVLDGIDFVLARAEQAAIVGASGSGKSTLMHCLGGLDQPTSGSVMLMGEPFSGLDRAAAVFAPLQLFHQHGYEFEYLDLVRLAQEPLGHLDAYDTVVIIGQFEYVPHAALAQLETYLASGGNLFLASNEFAIFRVRLDDVWQQLTTYKYDFTTEDPLYGSGSLELAGTRSSVKKPSR